MNRLNVYSNVLIALCICMSLTASVSAEVKLPKMKEGEWISSGADMKGMPGVPQGMMKNIKTITCIDEASQEKMLQETTEGLDGCKKPEISQSGKIYQMVSECSNDGKPVKVMAKINFLSDTKVASDISMSGGGMPNATVKSVMNYNGPCRAGLKPGDTKVEGMPDFSAMIGGMGGAEGMPDMEKLAEMMKNMGAGQQ